MRRLIALSLVVCLLAGGVPPAHAAEPPGRLSHESAAWSTAKQHSDYVLQIAGSGFTPFSMSFANLDARSICVFYTTSSPGYVVARAYAMATGGRLLAVGQPIRGYVANTLEALTVERAGWTGPRLNTGWRATPVVPRDGNASCLTTSGWAMNNGPHDHAWLDTAIHATANGLTRALIEIGPTYFNWTLLYGTMEAQYLQLVYERRPSVAVVHYDQSKPFTSRFTLDVLQEPRAFLHTYLVPVREEGGLMHWEEMPASEQHVRWRSFMVADAINAGISEGYALGMVPQKPAISGAGALAEASERGEAVVVLHSFADLGKLTPATEPATKAKTAAALAVSGTTVKATAAPPTASTGWRGTPWIVWRGTAATPMTVPASSYLGVRRGAAGPAGANPQGTTTAELTAHAKALTAVAGALAGLGGVAQMGGVGPVGQALGQGLVTLA